MSENSRIGRSQPFSQQDIDELLTIVSGKDESSKLVLTQGKSFNRSRTMQTYVEELADLHKRLVENSQLIPRKFLLAQRDWLVFVQEINGDEHQSVVQINPGLGSIELAISEWLPYGVVAVELLGGEIRFMRIHNRS